MMSNKADQLQLLKDEIARCKQCEELVNHRKQTKGKAVFDHDGNPNAKLVFIGQAPGAGENKTGKPFTNSDGSAGRFLEKEILPRLQLTRKDVFIGNIICCYPPPGKNKRDRKPSSSEVKNCRKFLDKTLEIIKPKFICCLGTLAAQKILGKNKPLQTKNGEKLLRGLHKGISVKGIDEKITVLCTFHPSSTNKDKILEDIDALMKEMKRK